MSVHCKIHLTSLNETLHITQGTELNTGLLFDKVNKLAYKQIDTVSASKLRNAPVGALMIIDKMWCSRWCTMVLASVDAKILCLNRPHV